MYMIRTLSPCCQSAGEKNKPQTSPAIVNPSAGQVTQGWTRDASRRNRPGLANRCKERVGRADRVVASTAER